MSAQINRAHIFGINDGTSPGEIQLYEPDGTTLAISGYVSPKLSSLNLTHDSSNEEVTDQFAEIDQVWAWREKFSMTLEVVPRALTLDDRIKAAAIPAAGGVCAIRNMQVLKAGSLDDVLNTTGWASGAREWIYLGGAAWNFISDEKMTLSLPLMRYPKITNPTLVT